MKKYKPKKWFSYARLFFVFLIIFTFGKTTNVVYNKVSSKNINDDKSLSQNVIINNKEELYYSSDESLNKYTKSNDKGFVLTKDNKTYEVTGDDYNLLVAVLGSESHTNYDDMLAVMSVILNRCDNTGATPVEVITRKNQFSGYIYGSYKRYLNEDGSLKDNSTVTKMKEVVDDALNGIRNNNYYSFRSWSVSSFSDNYIAWGGNRFK